MAQTSSSNEMHDLSALNAAITSALRAKRLADAARLADQYSRLSKGSEWHRCLLDDCSLHREVVPTPIVTLKKLEHDLQQFQYLASMDIAPKIADEAAHHLRAYISKVSSNPGNAGPLRPEDAEIARFYGRIVYKHLPSRPHMALSESWTESEVRTEYFAKPTQRIAVIDDFLTPVALQQLREFCLYSTVWHINRYSHGRLGAFFRDGFNSPLLIQICEEVGARLGSILEDHPMSQLWAFKNAPNQPQIPPHADFSLINVNFWISPDQSNTDCDSGGLVVYDTSAPNSWSFSDYNKNGVVVSRYLADCGARAVRIPYTANRAVIFDASLFHATESIRFRKSYEDRRINVTLSFGTRGNEL